MKTKALSETSLRMRAAGDAALLVEVPSLEYALGLRRQLRTETHLGIVDIIPTITTVLIIADSPWRIRSIVRYIGSLPDFPVHAADGREIQIPVNYNGADLQHVATLVGKSTEAFIQWHSAQQWKAAFAGFAPGFVYLVSDSGVVIPRKETPRTTVPKGSVAMAESYSSIYPRSSAGGWQLIGQTDAPLWDEYRDDPALIHPGDTVLFRPVHETISVTKRNRTLDGGQKAQYLAPDLTIVQPGVFATFQDLGRPGRGDLGVSVAGAMDDVALRAVNDLVGNRKPLAAIETFGAGFSMTAHTDQVIAVAGAATRVTLRARDSGDHVLLTQTNQTAFALLAGQTVSIEEADRGSWNYIGIRGGYELESILGSSSFDSHSGIGPKPLGAGAELRVNTDRSVKTIAPPVDYVRKIQAPRMVDLRVTLGPRHDWFEPSAIEAFLNDVWVVTPQVNRTAARLTGQPLTRLRNEELPSEGLVRGAIQVPADGQPLIFNADYPVTGGYPVIAVVIQEDLWRAAQVNPGSSVRFSLAKPNTHHLLPLDLEVSL